MHRARQPSIQRKCTIQAMSSPRSSSRMVASTAPFAELPPCSFSASPKTAGSRLEQSSTSRHGAQGAAQPSDQDAFKPGIIAINQVSHRRKDPPHGPRDTLLSLRELFLAVLAALRWGANN